MTFLIGIPSFVIGWVDECGLLTVLGIVLMASGVALLTAMWHARGKRPSDEELAQEWQDACDDLTQQLHLHRCPRPYEKKPPPPPDTVGAMEDEYQRHHRKRFLQLHDVSRRRVPYLADNRVRLRFYSPNPNQMWDLMGDIARHITKVLDPSRKRRKRA